jgi:hypothetical protein
MDIDSKAGNTLKRNDNTLNENDKTLKFTCGRGPRFQFSFMYKGNVENKEMNDFSLDNKMKRNDASTKEGGKSWDNGTYITLRIIGLVWQVTLQNRAVGY